MYVQDALTGCRVVITKFLHHSLESDVLLQCTHLDIEEDILFRLEQKLRILIFCFN